MLLPSFVPTFQRSTAQGDQRIGSGVDLRTFNWVRLPARISYRDYKRRPAQFLFAAQSNQRRTSISRDNEMFLHNSIILLIPITYVPKSRLILQHFNPTLLSIIFISLVVLWLCASSLLLYTRTRCSRSDLSFSEVEQEVQEEQNSNNSNI